MRGTHYNRVAGQNVERLAALSDGVFAVAMTLLVLDLHSPAAALVHSEADLLAAIGGLAPRLIIYLLSFMTLGIFWVGQQTQLNALARGSRDYTWMQLGFLVCITLMPFATQLMAEFPAFRTALLLYWADIALLGAALFASWRIALRQGLVDPADTALLGEAVSRRIVIAQSLYAIGAALCLIGTGWSIGFILLVQLVYVLAPRWGVLARL
jgi:uncharacterized membrane protein